MIYHFIDGVFVLEKEAFMSPFDLGVLRGYGVFDYVQLYKGKPFHLEDHLDRLAWSAAQIELTLPKSKDEIKDLVEELIEKNQPIDAGIRFLVTGGTCGREFLLPKGPSSFNMLFHPSKPQPLRYYTEGMRAVTFEIDRANPCVKTTNYTHAILAMKKAEKALVDDAIYVNPSGELLEATTSNVFFLIDGKWITAKNSEVVNGVTRGVLLKLIASEYPIEFRALHTDEIKRCEEAFLCSSVKDAISLVQIDHMKIGTGRPGAHTAKIRALYHDYIQNYFLPRNVEALIN